MKVVLFCGGLGLRLRDYADHIPKPMVPIGYRPILWHVMKYFAHFGHKDFILCLGHRGDLIKQYFLNYDECLSNDFVFSKGGRAWNWAIMIFMIGKSLSQTRGSARISDNDWRPWKNMWAMKRYFWLIIPTD